MPLATSSVSLAAVEAARAVPAGLAYLDMAGKYRLAQHLQIIDAALCDVEAGRCKRLIIEVPPRHGKSLLSSKYFPAWFLGRNPDRRVILASYGADLASDFGRAARDVLEAWGERVFGVKVSAKSSAANRWDIDGHRGGMITAGVGGPITGRGADVLIIDDPIKNREDAESKGIRDKQWGWFTSTAYTRLEPDGAIIVIQTRWHEDDIAGRLQQEAAAGGEQYRVIRLPAIADDDADELGRAKGEALWPTRYGLDRLQQIAAAVGSYVWNALYQQRPVAPEGNLLRKTWFESYDTPPTEFDAQWQSWDCTFKDTDGSDYVVGQVWGRVGADRYLLDQVRDRMDYPTTKRAMRALSKRWPNATAKYVEDKANGSAIISEMSREIPGIIPVNPEGGKVARVAAISPIVEAGNVWLPHRSLAAWVPEFIEECAAFPNGAHDDQVDAMSQGLVQEQQRVEPRMRSL